MLTKLALWLCLPAAALAVQDARESFEEVEKKIAIQWDGVRSLTADLREHAEVNADGVTMTRSATGTVEYAVRDGRILMRMVNKSENRLGGGERESVLEAVTTSVNDGEYIWMLNEQRGRKFCVKKPLSAQPVSIGGKPVFDMLRRDFDLSLGDDASVDGQPCWMIIGKPRAASPRGPAEIRQFIRKSDGVSIKQIGLDEQGRTTQTVELLNIRTGVDIPAERFQFKPPRDAQFLDETLPGMQP